MRSLVEYKMMLMTVSLGSSVYTAVVNDHMDIFCSGHIWLRTRNLQCNFHSLRIRMFEK